MEFSTAYLYAALAVGWGAGRLLPSARARVSRATFGAVLLLLGLLGASFRGLTGAELAGVLPSAVAFAIVVLAATIGAYGLLSRLVRPDGPSDTSGTPPPPERVPSSALVLAALVAGYGIGRAVTFPAASAVPWALALLLGMIGFGLELAWEPMRRAWLPISAAAVGAAVGGGVMAIALRLGAPVAWGTSFAFGWYSLAGPAVATRFGVTVGLFAFLANYLRELFTMLLAPFVGRRLGGEGLSAAGGATAMDTTLYFVVRHGDARAGSLALATGLALTVAAGLIVPALVAL